MAVLHASESMTDDECSDSDYEEAVGGEWVGEAWPEGAGIPDDLSTSELSEGQH